MVKGFKKLIVGLAVLCAVFAGGNSSFAAGMDTSGRYDVNHNLGLYSDANWYTKSADTVDMSITGNCNYLIGTHYWKANLQIFNDYTDTWNTISTTYTGYVSCKSYSYRSWDINHLTWLQGAGYPNGYANARIRLEMTGGAYAGDVYYTNLFRIDDQG